MDFSGPKKRDVAAEGDMDRSSQGQENKFLQGFVQ
jgi:hypothetical protein